MTGSKMKRSQDFQHLYFFLPQAEKMERRLNKKVFLKFMQLKQQQQQQEQKQQQHRQQLQEQLLLLPLLKQQQHVPMVFDE